MKTLGQRVLLALNLAQAAADLGCLGFTLSSSLAAVYGDLAAAIRWVICKRPPWMWAAVKRAIPAGIPSCSAPLSLHPSSLARAGHADNKAFSFRKQMNVGFPSDSWKKLFVTEPSLGLLY